MSIKQMIKGLFTSPEYFLVIGAGRGGTSLLASMLDYHPKLKIGFERFAFDYLLGQSLSTIEKVQANCRLSAFHKACKSEAVKTGEFWGNKITTEQIMAISECEGVSDDDVRERFVSSVVQSQKVVFIVRDGRYCVLSKMDRAGLTYDEALLRWKKATTLLTYFKEKGVNLHICKYEELLERPEKVLTGVCEFLGYGFDKAMLNGASNPMMPEMYAGKELRPVIGLTDEQNSWTIDMREELIQLGYINEN